MDFNVEKQQVCACRIVREAKAEQGVDSDITLPDYCSDIKSILCCSIEPGITSVGVTGNRITAEGNAVIRLMYVGADDKISCFEQNYPLSKYVEMNSLTPECQATASAKVGYVNCRAVSSRRVDVHGCVSVLFSAFCCESTQFVCSAHGEGVQLRLMPMNTCSAVGFTSKLFQMSEVIPINDNGACAKAVLHSSAFPVFSEIKAVSNKLLLKGELQLSVSLCCADASVRRIEHSLPLSRIVELDGINDLCICDVRAEVSSLDLKLRADENGEMRELDAAVCIRADVCGYRQLSCAYVDDIYSLKDEMTVRRAPIEENRFAGMLDEIFPVSFQPDFSGSEVGEIIDSWCDTVTCVSSPTDDGVELSGTLTLCVLYLDRDGMPALAQRQSDYRFTKGFDLNGGKLNCNPSVIACGASVSGKGPVLNAKVQLQASGCVFENVGVTVISSVEPVADSEKSSAQPAITVYFSESGERLWDIAKKYNTSEELIRQHNGVKGEILESDTMLIIPSCR